MKYLKIKLVKGVQDLHTENYKTPLKNIQDLGKQAPLIQILEDLIFLR